MALLDIKIALDSYLDTMGADTVAWEGEQFAPGSTSLYLRPTILPVASELDQLDRTHERAGIYQIDIIATRGLSVATVYAKAEEIRQHFLAVDSLTEGGTSLFLRQISALVLDSDEAYHYLPVQIGYVTYST